MDRLSWWCVLLSVLGAANVCGVMQKAQAQDAASLVERLHRADAESSLEDASLQPWHLKMSVQMYDDAGAPTEKGTVEEWWSGPGLWRAVYALPSYKATEVKNSEGHFATPETSSPPYYLEALRQQVVHPLGGSDALRDSVPDLRKQSFGKADLDCIMMDQPIKMVAYPPLGLFPTYCLDRAKDSLRVSFEFGTQSTIRAKVGSFQKRTVPLDLGINVGSKQAASAHIDVLEGRTAPYTEMLSSEGLVPRSERLSEVAGGLINGRILSKTAPIYPEAAKLRHASGTVLFRAIIGTDGHVHRLRLLTVPDPDLAMAAIAAVRQWTYKPWLINGVATEVDTTITVNFNLGRP